VVDLAVEHLAVVDLAVADLAVVDLAVEGSRWTARAQRLRGMVDGGW
jgi:hypothetical protein